MLPELRKNKEFSSIINKFYIKYKNNILDILLFGSIVRGKDKPNDVDIMVVFKNNEDLDAAYELRKSLRYLNIEIQVTTKTYKQLFEKSFMARESFLGEGYSLLLKQYISEGLGYSSKTLFKYELKGFAQTRRMQLQYALYGRKRESGIAKELNLIKFAGTIFLCPVENTEKLAEFFENWGIRFEKFPVLIPQRIISA